MAPRGWDDLTDDPGPGLAFAAPLLLVERRDALSAALASLRPVWRGRPATFLWAGTALSLFLLSVATCFLGLVVAFPLLGHAARHALQDLRPDPRARAPLARRRP